MSLDLQSPKMNDESIKKIHEILTFIAPHLGNALAILKRSGITDFNIELSSGDTFKWSDPMVPYKPSPTQASLAKEIFLALEATLPSRGYTIMGMEWNPHKIIAEKLAEIMAKYRRKDHS